MTAPERIWATLNVSPIGSILQGTLEVEGPSEVAAQVEYVRADLYATLAAKCEVLERELAAKSRPLDPRIKAAIQEGYNAEAVALEKQVSEALAARVRSLEEALMKIANRSGLLSADYVSYGGESGHAETERIARAALTREDGKT